MKKQFVRGDTLSSACSSNHSSSLEVCSPVLAKENLHDDAEFFAQVGQDTAGSFQATLAEESKLLQPPWTIQQLIASFKNLGFEIDVYDDDDDTPRVQIWRVVGDGDSRKVVDEMDFLEAKAPEILMDLQGRRACR